MKHILDFEEPVILLENQLENLKKNLDADSPILDDLSKLDLQISKMLNKIYSNLDPLQFMAIARHPERPTGKHYIEKLIKDFLPISGDRAFKDDKALICGIGRFNEIPVAIMAHNKGYDMEERIETNFGMALPEGYRKAKRVMQLANKFQLPIIAFIDTKGAAANQASEERGQSFALAECICESFNLKTPLISVIVGEGGSGGAIALASGHSLMMLKYSIFSVASPDACAAILWKSRDYVQKAANALKITSKDLLNLGVIDAEIKEPHGAAHRFPEQTFKEVEKALLLELNSLMNLSLESLRTKQKNRMARL